MSNYTDNALSVREPAQKNTAPTSMSLYKPSTVYDKKSFELSVTTRSTSLPFPNTAMFKLPDDNDKLAFTIPFNSIYRRLLDNDLYNERLLCVVNGGDPYYGANLINNLCGVLSSSLDTYVVCPQVKSQEVSVVRQADATIEEAMKNKLGYNYAYHQRMIAYGKIKTPGEYITLSMYNEYIDYIKGKFLSGSPAQSETFIRYVPSDVHCVSFHSGRYYFGTNHGVFMSENPFLDNTELCSQASVVWPYGYNDGQKFVDYDTYDALHAGLFNHTAVEGMTSKTMLGPAVRESVRENPTAKLEESLPRFDVFAFMPVSFNSSALSAIEGVAGTSNGFWVLVNMSDPNDSRTHKVSSIVGWEEDQVSSVVLSYQWTPINQSCRNPDGAEVDLIDQRITSVVRSEDDPSVFYLGTPHGLFTCKLRGVRVDENEYGDDEVYVGADFRYVYGYYDASISSMVYVQPAGYDGSVLAGTDYGVLQAANSWYPRIDKTYGNWLPNIDFNLSAVTGIGVQTPGIPRLVALSSNTVSAMYKISDAGALTPIYTGNVYGIYSGVLDNAWVVVAYNPSVHKVEVLKVPVSDNPPTLQSSNIINNSITEVTGIRKCMVSPTGSIYLMVSGSGKEDKLYQFTRRWETNENTLKLTTYTPKSGQKVIGFAFAENDKLSSAYPHDTVFAATVSSIYAFTIGAETVIDFFTPASNVSDGSDLSVVGHATFSEYNTEVIFYQNASGTYAGKAQDFASAKNTWKQINSVGAATAIDDSITALYIQGHGTVVATRGGLYNAGLTENNELWFGVDETNPNPVIEGVFTGAVLLDDPNDVESGVKFLVLAGNGKLYLYRFNPTESEFTYEDQLTGISDSTTRIIPDPFNDMYQLSALVIKNTHFNSVTTSKIIDTSDFDPSASTYEFSDITVEL